MAGRHTAAHETHVRIDLLLLQLRGTDGVTGDSEQKSSERSRIKQADAGQRMLDATYREQRGIAMPATRHRRSSEVMARRSRH